MIPSSIVMDRSNLGSKAQAEQAAHYRLAPLQVDNTTAL